MTDTQQHVTDHPLDAPTDEMVLANEKVLDKLRDDSYMAIPGFDALFFRNLANIAELTGGKFAANLQRANPDSPWEGSTWHMHHCDLQYSYILSGTAKFEFEGLGIVEMKAGDALYQPPNNRHREFEISPDFEVFQIVSPATFETTHFNWDEETGSWKAIRADTLDEEEIARQRELGQANRPTTD